MILVGALFALSFDTMSQVAFFSISVQAGQSWMTPMLLGLVFMLGMIVTDGLNGCKHPAHPPQTTCYLW